MDAVEEGEEALDEAFDLPLVADDADDDDEDAGASLADWSVDGCFWEICVFMWMPQSSLSMLRSASAIPCRSARVAASSSCCCCETTSRTCKQSLLVLAVVSSRAAEYLTAIGSAALLMRAPSSMTSCFQSPSSLLRWIERPRRSATDASFLRNE